MDFRIPGLPHSAVKHAQSASVRHLIQKIENHPNRHALQQDLRQNQPFNPFSPDSKQMIRDVGNIMWNTRDEDVCRQWDALADEDHTHHLTPQVFSIITRVIGGFIRTSKVPTLCQWSTELTLNKHCLPCSKWNKKKELAEINNGLLLLQGGVGKVHGGLLIPWKVTMEMNQVLTEQGDLLYKYLEQFFRVWFSWILLLCSRWIVYSWWWSTVTDVVCEYHTSNDVFPRCKSVHKMASGKSDDELIQSDNKMRTRSGKFIIVYWTWLRDKAWRGRQWQHLWLRGTA